MKKIKIAIFASGSGSNAQKIMEHFQNHEHIEVSLVLSNVADAFVLQRASHFGVPTFICTNEAFKNCTTIIEELHHKAIDFVVLAGFLRLIPKALIQAFPNKIVNIHPSLLPKFGGKGMYGNHVHQAVLEQGETKSGITIHFVNEHFDEGTHIFQASFEIEKTDTVSTIAGKCHALEHLYFPKVIEETITKTFDLAN